MNINLFYLNERPLCSINWCVYRTPHWRYHCFNLLTVQVFHDEPEKEFEDSSDVEDTKEEEAFRETSRETDNIASKKINKGFQGASPENTLTIEDPPPW